MANLTVNQRELSRVLSLDPRHVRRLDEKGLPSTLTSDGSRLYDLTTAVPWYISNLKNRLKNTEKEQAEIRERKAKAAMAELELAERVGALVPVEYVEETLGPVLEDVRAKVVNLPGRVAPLFPNPRKATEILIPATDECLAALQELAGDLERQAGDPLPDDFPGLRVLHEAGVRTFQELREVKDLTAIRGIGLKMERRINQGFRTAA